MAYKFQVGAAKLSGSTTFEDEHILSGSVYLPGVSDAAAAVGSDSLYFLDADGSVKRDSMADYATAIAGDALGASSGVLAVQVDDTGIETNSDALRLKDNGVTLAKMAGITRGSILSGDASGDPQYLALGGASTFLQSDGTDLAYVTMSGDATLSAGALTIAANAVDVSKIEQVAANSLLVRDAGSEGNLSEFALATTQIMIGDGAGFTAAALSGDVTMTNAGVVSIGATKVTDAMINDDVASGLAGAGLAASGGAMALDLSEYSIVAPASGDHLMTLDSDDANEQLTTTDGLATLFAGSGIAAASAVLSLDISEYSAVAAAHGDSFLTLDSDGSTEQLCTTTTLASLFAGAGLAAASSVLAVVNATNGGLTINANDMEVDLNDLAGAVADVANDSIAIIDATDNGSKKESIADFVSAIADGSTITATAGVLSVAGSQNIDVNGRGTGAQTLTAGMNFGNAELTGNSVWTLPASPTVGDICYVKAPSSLAGYHIAVTCAGSHKIDNQLDEVELESADAAVSLVYVEENNWVIF